MQRFYEDVSYEAVARNSMIFESAHKIYVMALHIDINNCDINDILEDLHQLECNRVSTPTEDDEETISCANFYQNDVALKRMLLIRTIIFQSIKYIDTSEHVTNPKLENAIRFLRLQQFHEGIEKDEALRMRMKVYVLLINADRQKSSVEEAFVAVNSCMEKIREIAREKPMKLVDGVEDLKLRQAIENLLHVCLRDTNDAEHCEELLIKFSFQDLFACLCNDIIDSKFNTLVLERASWNLCF